MLVSLAAIPLLGLAQPRQALAQDDWVRQCESHGGSGTVHCEVRPYSLPGTGGVLSLDTGGNGGIRVQVWDRAEVKVEARIRVQDKNADAAKALAGSVEIVVNGRSVEVKGPKPSKGQGWSVSYEVWAPAATDTRLRTTNGGVDVGGLSGSVDAETTNGGVEITGQSGSVRAITVNGGVRIEMAAPWKGADVRAKTVNGGVELVVPGGVSARLEASTTNGGITVGFPITVQGDLGRRHVSATLGSGGPLIDLAATNGGIQITRK